MSESDDPTLTPDRPVRMPGAERRDHVDRRSEDCPDRRAHDRYKPLGSQLVDRRQGDRRRAEN